jgi:hypothetical protein
MLVVHPHSPALIVCLSGSHIWLACWQHMWKGNHTLLVERRAVVLAGELRIKVRSSLFSLCGGACAHSGAASLTMARGHRQQTRGPK